MSYPYRFISLANFELAFTRMVRGQNREYKNLFRHLYPSYQLGLRDNLEDLIDDIKRGSYGPSPATCVFKPKKSGILRPLRLLVLQDQIVYQAITTLIATAFKPVQDNHALKRCFGAIVNDKSNEFFYRAWKRCYRSFDQAMTKTYKAGNDYVADFDLVSFYELIDHKLLRDVLERRFKEPEVLDLLFRCLEKWTENDKGLCLHHGIPQGPEPSAFLAECFLFSFDSLQFKGAVYLRYVDDIKLMGKDETPVRRALVKLDIASKQLGLVPQAQKIECRRIKSIDELRKNVPSSLASISPSRLATAATQRRLRKVFNRSLKKQNGCWTITDETKLKFALFRMNPNKQVLRRTIPLLDLRPDLSWLFASYFRKFPDSSLAADSLLGALQKDPTYDASAADYIEAMDVCEPSNGGSNYRRMIQTAERRSEERGMLLAIAATTFRARRSGPKDALKLVEKQEHPLARSILIHRLFGNASKAPFKVVDSFSLIDAGTQSSDADLARFCADLLLDVWPWTKSSWTPGKHVHHSVKLLMKTLGLRSRTPKKKGILEKFFEDRMKIGIKLNWRKALGSNRRHSERSCLRLQRYEIGDPTPWIMLLDTFNEGLIDAFSAKHSALKSRFKVLSGKHVQPDIGKWLNEPLLAGILLKSISWFKAVHNARVGADMAHAKSRKGVPTKPVPFKERDKLQQQAQSAWAELILEWSRII